MSDESLNRQERDTLVEELKTLTGGLYPQDRSLSPDEREVALLRERYYAVLGEYADRLPRMVLSRCPHCETPLKRAFDPYGLDGPWWWLIPLCKFEEPQCCDHFKVLLGAVDLHGREPIEVDTEVRPGPDVPFVVPALLASPGMIVVVGKIALSTGDTAYPIAYFSTSEIEPIQLHQPWCRNELWFTDEDDNPCWTAANDVFDFDLLPYVTDGRMRWVDLDDPKVPLYPAAGEKCPFLNLSGDRERQQIVGGSRELIGLPDGEPLNPFEE